MATLERMRKPSTWMKATGDLGLMPEDEVNERERPGGTWETKATPELSPEGGSFDNAVHVTLSVTLKARRSPGRRTRKKRLEAVHGAVTIDRTATLRAARSGWGTMKARKRRRYTA